MWHHLAGLSAPGLLCTTVLVMPGSKDVLAAENTLGQNINNSYLGIYRFLLIHFTIHPNYLTLTCEANGEYSLLLFRCKESPSMDN